MKYILIIWIFAAQAQGVMTVQVTGPQGCIDELVDIVSRAPAWFDPARHLAASCGPVRPI